MKIPKWLDHYREPDDRIIVCEEKHYTLYYRADTLEDILDSSFSILKRRLNDDRYYIGKEEENAFEIFQNKDRIGAFSFLMNRNGYEYEGFEIEQLNT